MVAPSDSTVLEGALREGDPDRWAATRLAALPARADLVALYGFNVELARIVERVREPMLGQIRLQWWRERLLASEAPPAPTAPLEEALVGLIARRAAIAPVLDRMISLRTEQIGPEVFASDQARQAWMDGVGCALGEAAAIVLAVQDARALALAQRLGAIWARVGELRAEGWWASIGRDRLAHVGADRAGWWAAEVRACVAIESGVRADFNESPPATRAALLGGMAHLALTRADLRRMGAGQPFAPPRSQPVVRRLVMVLAVARGRL